MNLSTASKEFVIYCLAAGRGKRYAAYFRKLLRKFIEANGNQDTQELSRSHIQLYLATELGEVRGIKLRPVSVLRRECDLLIVFYKWLAVQGLCEPLHTNQLRSPFRRRKGVFHYAVDLVTIIRSRILSPFIRFIMRCLPTSITPIRYYS